MIRLDGQLDHLPLIVHATGNDLAGEGVVAAQYTHLHRTNPLELVHALERHAGLDVQWLVLRQQMDQLLLLVGEAVQAWCREVEAAVARAGDHRFHRDPTQQGGDILLAEVAQCGDVGGAGEAAGQLRGDAGQWLPGADAGLLGADQVTQVAVLRHADDVGVGTDDRLRGRHLEEQQVALVDDQGHCGGAGAEEQQRTEGRLQALCGRTCAGLLGLALLDVVLALHDVEQAVDVGDVAGHVGGDDVAQDVALLPVELDELGADFAAALRDDLQLGIDVQVDRVQVQLDRAVEQAADLQRLIQQQADSAQGNVLDLALQFLDAVACQGQAGRDLGANELAFIDRFMNNVCR